jgi:HSP20 family protein
MSMADTDVKTHSSPVRWDPFAEMDRLRRDMNELWTRWPATEGARSVFEPLADIEETDDAWIIEIELPGVDKQDIDVELSARLLRITAERKERERTGILRQKKRVTGSFRYEVMLPTAFDESGVTAALAEGELTVRIPKAAADQPRKVKIG